LYLNQTSPWEYVDEIKHIKELEALFLCETHFLFLGMADQIINKNQTDNGRGYLSIMSLLNDGIQVFFYF
jgi:hypothetical protein